MWEGPRQVSAVAAEHEEDEVEGEERFDCHTLYVAQILSGIKSMERSFRFWGQAARSVVIGDVFIVRDGNIN